MTAHSYEWYDEDDGFESSIPPTPPITKDFNSIIQCDSHLTNIMTDIERELHMKICIFSTPWPVTNFLDCGRDSLRVLMCRKPFKLYEKVIKPHCKPKPCKAYRELPVSQFSQGNPCFHYREPLFSLQGPCFHYRDFPVNPCTSLLGIAV